MIYVKIAIPYYGIAIFLLSKKVRVMYMGKIENDDIKTLMLKKEDAVCCVKDNLRRYVEIKLYPQTVVDRVSGYSTSLLIVSS